MKYVDQTLESMLLYIVSRTLDTSIFTVISQSSFIYNDIKITFGILAESHFATIESKDATFNEVCACAEFDIDNIIPKNIFEIQNQTLNEETEQYSYQFSTITLETRQGKKKLKALRRKRRSLNTHYLAHTFPSKWIWSKSAVTEIYITEADAITIESVHTYPNEEMIVFTESTYSTK